jgi:hypothetical protein
MAVVTHKFYNRFLGLRIRVFCSVLILSGGVCAKTINVATVGEFTSALSGAIAGDTVLVKSGKYRIPYNANAKNTIDISVSGQNGKNIYIISSDNSRALFDFSYTDNSKALNTAVTSYGFFVTGSYLYFKGIDVTHAGYQGVYVMTGGNITFESCSFYDNFNTGFEINNGGHHITVINCDAYRNFDKNYKFGSMSDGFGPKEKQGEGNKFVGCRAWENSDDGFDTYNSDKAVLFENCWAFRNGENIWNFTAMSGNNQNGFKVGGVQKIQRNVLKNCVSFGHAFRGFDRNTNMGGVTIYNCISYNNGTNYAFSGDISSGEKHIFKNNIAIDGKVELTAANTTESNNSWNTGFYASAADFESLDTSLATIARNSDGSLPETKLFRLKPTSTLINKGVDVGLPFNGRAPDLGAFEKGGETNAIVKNASLKKFAFIQAFSQNQLCIILSKVTKKARVSIFSLNGVKVLNTTISNSQEVTIDCSFLKPGFYLTEVETGGVSKRLKFLK